MPKKKRNIMRKFKMTEISSVDRPAQSPALATIMKRDDSDKIEKKFGLTSASEGHSHLIMIDDSSIIRGGGETWWGEGHDHPFILSDDGIITIGHSHGHTHVLSSPVQKFQEMSDEESKAVIAKLSKPDLTKTADTGGDPKHEETAMSKETENAEKLTATQAELTKVQAQLAKSTLILELTEVQKSFYLGLSATDKDAFLEKSAEDKDKDVDMAKSANPVIYKSASGTEYLKSDDPRLVVMAKERDDDRAELAKSQKEAKEAGYAKRAATEFSSLPGDSSTHIAVLKALDTIKDDTVRQASFDMLKAKNTSMSSALSTVGHSVVGGDNGDQRIAKSAEDELETKTKEYMKKENMTQDKYYDAYDIVSQIHPDLLEKALKG